MKKLVLLFTALILGTTGIMANTSDDKVAERNAYRYDKSFIFVESGITFSVYPDGEFDFSINDRIGNRRKNVTFNSGYDYSAYAQYDDYGAVVQVENVPIYYDNFGRVSQIGDTDIRYRNGRVRGIGNMNVFYNNRGFYDYHTGYINSFNRYYVYRPFHGFFVRPAIGFCLVNRNPYRRWYNPIRYTFYNPYRFNRRNSYAKIGREHRYNRVRKQRAGVYRNDRRVAVRENGRRVNRTVARSNSNRGNRNLARNNDTRRNNRTIERTTTRSSNTKSQGRNKTIRNSNYRKGIASNERTVTRRTVTKTPRTTTVKRNTKTTVRKPVTRTQRTIKRLAQRTTRNTTSRSSNQRSYKAPVRSSRSTASRSTASRSVKQAPARSSRSNRSVATSRSRGRQ